MALKTEENPSTVTYRAGGLSLNVVAKHREVLGSPKKRTTIRCRNHGHWWVENAGVGREGGTAPKG